MAKVGVLALQGDVAEHAGALSDLGAHVVEVRSPQDLTGIDALVLPGGESTTMSLLLDSAGLFDPIAARLAEGMPAFGTCAGMILLANDVLDGRPDQHRFGAIDIAVRRNAFGRQVDSFEADLELDERVFGERPGASSAGPASCAGPASSAGPAPASSAAPASASSAAVVPPGPAPRPSSAAALFPAIFILAPVVERAGAGVEILATVDGYPVLCRQGPVLVAAFHPELSDDLRLHQLFLGGL